MEKTTNYNLKKPGGDDFYNVHDQNDNMDIIDTALSPTADPSQAPSGDSGKLSQWVGWIANRIKAITGAENWYDAPAMTLASVATQIGSEAQARSAADTALGNSINGHTANRSNPHGVTAAQVGALPTSGGTLTGQLNIANGTKLSALILENDWVALFSSSNSGNNGYRFRIKNANDLLNAFTFYDGYTGATYKLYGEHNITVSTAAPGYALAEGAQHQVY